jgi:hypothetical protein
MKVGQVETSEEIDRQLFGSCVFGKGECCSVAALIAGRISASLAWGKVRYCETYLFQDFSYRATNKAIKQDMPAATQ